MHTCTGVPVGQSVSISPSLIVQPAATPDKNPPPGANETAEETQDEQVLDTRFDRQMQLMQLAGSAPLTFGTVNNIPIMSFGFDETTKAGLNILSTNTELTPFEPHTAPVTSVHEAMTGMNDYVESQLRRVRHFTLCTRSVRFCTCRGSS